MEIATIEEKQEIQEAIEKVMEKISEIQSVKSKKLTEKDKVSVV
jgi:hypothetical protein